MEHGGHHVGVGDPVPFHEAQPLGGVPVIHDDEGHAVEERHGHREGERGGVVQRSGQEVRVHALRVVLVVPAEVDGGQRAHDRRVAVHAFGPSRGARRVEHLGADHRVVDVRAVLGGDHRVVHLETRHVARGVDLHQAGVARLGGHRDLVTQIARADERLGLAVLDDVGRLGPGEVPVDGGEPKPDALGGVEDLEELGPVGAHQGDGVAGLQTPGPQCPRQPVDVGVQVLVGPVAVGRHEREAVRDALGPPGVEHALGRRGELVLGDAHGSVSVEKVRGPSKRGACPGRVRTGAAGARR